MGGRAATCPVDISNHTLQINGGNPLFDDLWDRGCNSSRNKLSNTENQLILSYGNNELLEKNLDLIEERKERATIQLAYYQHKLKQGYDAKVKLRPLAPRDLVLRNVLGIAKKKPA